ncbi:hypothetical protein BRADI_1g67290v3 [Brachypodium distachyon]|uniref:Glycine-rich protein n=1 Tax=Brachypodium distachyon TaxID=15368 RepID=A0A0Q3HI27_BRADI|nr:hypothetical protein BRADI_1g67290v3 [Brachypodium distachyon]
MDISQSDIIHPFVEIIAWLLNLFGFVSGADCFLWLYDCVFGLSLACVVKGKRTIWRLSIIPDFFKAVLNFIRMFFLTMFSIEKTDSYKKGYGGGKKWDGGPGGGGPGGGPYGGGGGGGGGPRGPRTLSDLRSNDQSSLPACGSCCG